MGGSIKRLGRGAYLAFFKESLKEALGGAKKGACLAFLMSDWNDNENIEQGMFVWDYANLIMAAGWSLLRQIQVPLSTQQVHPSFVLKYREARKLARLNRYLLMAVKR